MYNMILQFYLVLWNVFYKLITHQTTIKDIRDLFSEKVISRSGLCINNMKLVSDSSGDKTIKRESWTASPIFDEGCPIFAYIEICCTQIFINLLYNKGKNKFLRFVYVLHGSVSLCWIRQWGNLGGQGS